MTVTSQTLALQDVRCAGCVLKIERRLAQLPGVQIARGNASQRRLRLVWDDGLQTLDQLTQSIRDLGYDATQIRAEQRVANEPSLLPRLAVAASGMMNIMAFSLSVWFGAVTDMGPGSMQFMHWLSAGIALPVMLYSGSVFHRPAIRAMRAGHMTMDTPITLAIWITFAGSLFETLRGSAHVYFDAVVALIFFLLIGRVLEQAMRRRSDNAAENLRELLNVTANRIGDDCKVTTMPASALVPGDCVLVQTGERVPADGRLLSAQAEFDESVLTGEIKPRRLLRDETVAAGAVLTLGPAEVIVSHVGDASQIGQLAQLVEDVSGHKGRLQLLSDQFARGYIPLVLVGGAFGFVMWFWAFGASFAEALKIAVSVLIVTCPCAAGLATPAVASRAINLALRDGVIIKTGKALELLGDVDQIYLDKTGTAALPELSPDTELDPKTRVAARRLAVASKHPLAQSLVGGANIAPVRGAVEHAGLGIEGPDGARLGRAEFVGLTGIAPDQTTLFYCDADGGVSQIRFQETARPELDAFLCDAHKLRLKVVLHSGDVPASVARFARRVGIKTWFAAQTPHEKLNRITEQERQGARILMVGDGVNDSAALSGATVSASFAGATDIAQSTADIVLTQPHLGLLPKAIVLARSTRRLVVQNLAFSSIYNIVTVPLALAGMLTPAIAALLMSSSSLIVLANAARLRTLR